MPKAIRRLLVWFGRTKRGWPWRRRRTPYKVWISEVMLQQTVVAAVAPRFESWMKRFPDVASLASASEREVLREWEGLGYYSRARNLLTAAKIINRRFHGGVPRDIEDLRSLPGIGPYTAAAIASLAFGAPAPLIDANVRRIVARLKGWRAWNPQRERLTLDLLSRWMPKDRAGEFNESLMELGQRVCLGSNALCGECPLKTVCRSAGKSGSRTGLSRLKTRTVFLESAVAVVLEKGAVRLRKETSGRFRGLWMLPRFPGKTLDPSRFRIGLAMAPSVHAYTHHRETLRPYLVSAVPGIRKDLGERVSWKEAERRAMPSPHRRILRSAIQVFSESEKKPRVSHSSVMTSHSSGVMTCIATE